jgi:YVTN family beta-propeller protein
MIPCVLIFPAGCLRRCIPPAVLLAALAPLAWAAAEEASWGRLITSAAIVCNPSTHKIYAVNEGTGFITVIDAATGAMHTVQVGREPIAIAVNSATNRIYIANDGSASVSVIDGTNDTVIATVTSAPLPYTLAVDETTNTIYVTHTYSGSVTVIDGISNTARELKVGDADSIALDPRTGTVFLSTYEDPSIRFVNEATGAVTKASVGPHVWGMVFDQPSGTLFLTHTAGAGIVALDVETHAVRTLPVGSIPCALAINPVTRRLYVVNYGDNTLSILDLQTRTTIATLPVGLHPQGLAVDSKSNRIYVANVQGNSVTVIDGARNAVIGVRNAGSHPYAVAVDQSSGHAYAANYGAPWVTPLPDAPRSIPSSPGK